MLSRFVEKCLRNSTAQHPWSVYIYFQISLYIFNIFLGKFARWLGVRVQETTKYHRPDCFNRHMWQPYVKSIKSSFYFGGISLKLGLQSEIREQMAKSNVHFKTAKSQTIIRYRRPGAQSRTVLLKHPILEAELFLREIFKNNMAPFGKMSQSIVRCSSQVNRVLVSPLIWYLLV